MKISSSFSKYKVGSKFVAKFVANYDDKELTILKVLPYEKAKLDSSWDLGNDYDGDEIRSKMNWYKTTKTTGTFWKSERNLDKYWTKV